jgi:cytochrome c553
MKLIGVHFLVQIMILVPTASARGGNADFSQQELQAKLVYCKTCHGLAGQGYRGSRSMPRLAGQQAEYLENQLSAFVEGRRKDNFMSKVATVLSPPMVRAVAKHFSELNPKPFGGSNEELAAVGKALYEEGIPGSDIPSCAACHRPDAKGDGACPRLAGQLPDYTVRTLVNWSKERGQDPNKPDTSAIMAPIAHSLTSAQISAIAAYLGGLK